jgi:ubiquinone/menaquinone biosynthesis C-methylase UbiE
MTPWLYDLLMAPADWLGFARYRARLMRGLTGRVLELGAGTGRNGRENPTNDIVCLDRDLASLQRARAQGLTAVVCADASALPFKTRAFDAVVESLVFCSLPEPTAALAEIRRVLEPEGELRMIDHVLGHGRVGRLQQALAPAWLHVTGECHLNRDVSALLAPSGFRVLHHEARCAGTIQELILRPSS